MPTQEDRGYMQEPTPVDPAVIEQLKKQQARLAAAQAGEVIEPSKIIGDPDFKVKIEPMPETTAPACQPVEPCQEPQTATEPTKTNLVKAMEVADLNGAILLNEINQPSKMALHLSAKAWQFKCTDGIQFDARIALALAVILDDVLDRPCLGNATTEEMLDEIRSRCEIHSILSYKTTRQS